MVTVALVLPLRWLAPPTTSFMLQNPGAPPDGSRGGGSAIHYVWVPVRGISAHVLDALLAAEDQKFYAHSGFDLQSISDVLHGARGGRPARGASTISQQLAKNLWLWPGRSWLRKGLEAWLTVWLELLLPKVRILEIYANVAQFGPHTYGVEAAARRYFRQSAAELDAAESALLAAVLPNPVLYRIDRPSDHVRKRQAWIQQQAARLPSDDGRRGFP